MTPDVMLKGVTVPHHASRYAASAGGVGCQYPTPPNGGGGAGTSAPSVARDARILSATVVPHAMPADFTGVSGMVARCAALSASKLPLRAGNRATRARCAAAVAAASFDAATGAPSLTKY